MFIAWLNHDPSNLNDLTNQVNFLFYKNTKNIQVYASKNARASDLQSLYYNAFDTVHDRKYVEYPVMW